MKRILWKTFFELCRTSIQKLTNFVTGKSFYCTSSLYEVYSYLMKDYLESTHVNLAVDSSSDVSRCYYIPHFHVFDASVVPPGGESNQTLLTGRYR